MAGQKRVSSASAKAINPFFLRRKCPSTSSMSTLPTGRKHTTEMGPQRPYRKGWRAAMEPACDLSASSPALSNRFVVCAKPLLNTCSCAFSPTESGKVKEEVELRGKEGNSWKVNFHPEVERTMT